MNAQTQNSEVVIPELEALEIRNSFNLTQEISNHGIATESKIKTLKQSLENLNKKKLSNLEIFLIDQYQGQNELSNFLKSINNWQALKTICVRFATIKATKLPVALMELHDRCRSKQITLFVDLILPDDADGFESQRSNSPHFATILKFSQSLHEKHINVRWLLPLVGSLVFRIEGIFLRAQDVGVECLLVPPERLCNSHYTTAGLSHDEKLFVWDFISNYLLDFSKVQLKKGQFNYYSTLISYLDSNNKANPAMVPTLNYSSESQKWILQTESEQDGLSTISITPSEDKDESSSSYKHKITFLVDVGSVLIGGLRAHIANFLTGISSTDKSPPNIEQRSFNKALLIGAYGGEHIGDIAILGGVLFRIYQRYGITEAVLFTQRPMHTRHLIPMLDVPVNVTVDVYDSPQIYKHMATVDCIVFAGGPLIDLPKQLIRHLLTVSLGRKLNKPFIAEGIGPGPFARLPSKYTAHKLMRMASYISLRTIDSAKHDLVKDLDVNIGHCPAFDYLDTRKNQLSRLPQNDEIYINKLLTDTKDRIIIGINIRPIGHLYTAGVQGGDAEAYTRKIEQRFEQRFADGLRAYDQQSKKKPCFIFFPMNAIQFGMSDILSAYRIKHVLGSEVDFRVWQSDASLDGVIALMRHIDIAITMRFHATIFALSQQCKVIGIDYRIGKRDKVAELLDDVEQGENCTRIDLLTEQWLKERLVTLSRQTTILQKAVC